MLAKLTSFPHCLAWRSTGNKLPVLCVEHRGTLKPRYIFLKRREREHKRKTVFLTAKPCDLVDLVSKMLTPQFCGILSNALKFNEQLWIRIFTSNCSCLSMFRIQKWRKLRNPVPRHFEHRSLIYTIQKTVTSCFEPCRLFYTVMFNGMGCFECTLNSDGQNLILRW